MWARCRACGNDYSTPVDEFTGEELDDINDSLSGESDNE